MSHVSKIIRIISYTDDGQKASSIIDLTNCIGYNEEYDKWTSLSYSLIINLSNSNSFESFIYYFKEKWEIKKYQKDIDIVLGVIV